MGPRRHRRGRRRCQRRVSGSPSASLFVPRGASDGEPVHMYIEEFEALRLVDREGLTQTEAAVEMGISQKTLWKDLKQARSKVAEAIVNGRPIEIEKGYGDDEG
ncbi:MAG: DUF134 domain-containing protein [Candidatus Thermoplasmatota archaeon]|nr:DUF134 domain-containing protein [Candidatus Thermoplasmatota archaeon]